MAKIAAHVPYKKRKAPQQYGPGFFDIELGNIARAIAPVASILVKSSLYSPTVADDLILVDASAAAVHIRLPTPSRVTNARFTIKKIDSSVNTVLIIGEIDGVMNPTLSTQWSAVTVQSDGITYYKLASV